METNEEPQIINQPVFDGKKRPTGKWMLASVFVVLIAGIIAASAFLINDKEKNAKSNINIKLEPQKEDVVVGGKATPDYNNKVIEKTTQEAEQAQKSGRSYMPTPVNNTTAEALNVEKNVNNRVNPQEQQKASQQFMDYKKLVHAEFAAINNGITMSAQTTINFTDQLLVPEKNDVVSGQLNANNEERTGYPSRNTATGETVESKVLRLPDGIHAGSILYATNDLKLNSDGSNKVVRATVISGPLKNYIAIGKFDNAIETLSITITRLISPEGREYPITGYAIDPTIPEANVASDVDHHYLSRWGGLAAASFLAGFADATRMSGVTSNSSSFLQGGLGTAATYGSMTIPTYTLTQKGIMGAGEVGRQIGAELAKGVNRPATIELDPGIPMGIFIVGAGNLMNTNQNQ